MQFANGNKVGGECFFKDDSLFLEGYDSRNSTVSISQKITTLSSPLGESLFKDHIQPVISRIQLEPLPLSEATSEPRKWAETALITTQ